jgi:hypothetical protein
MDNYLYWIVFAAMLLVGTWFSVFAIQAYGMENDWGILILLGIWVPVLPTLAITVYCNGRREIKYGQPEYRAPTETAIQAAIQELEKRRMT